MKSFVYFFLFLVTFFEVIPLLMNFTPKFLRHYWHRKQQCSSCPKFVDFMLAASMAVFNMIYFACYPHCWGLVGSSLLMFCMMKKRFAFYVLSKLRHNQKFTCMFAAILLLLAFSPQTFPIAIVMGLMLDFACLLPKHQKGLSSDANHVDTVEIKSDEGIKALNHFVDSFFDDAEEIITEPIESKNDNTSSVEKTVSDVIKDNAYEQCPCKDARISNMKVYEPVHVNRPNRHSNGSNYKRASKNSVSRSPMKHFSSKRSNRFSKNKSQRCHG